MIGWRRGTLLFFFNDTATTEIYTLSLHDALPICAGAPAQLIIQPPDTSKMAPVTNSASGPERKQTARATSSGSPARPSGVAADRKSTRLNSSHANISYAVFCLKKKKIPSALPTIR